MRRVPTDCDGLTSSRRVTARDGPQPRHRHLLPPLLLLPAGTRRRQRRRRPRPQHPQPWRRRRRRRRDGPEHAQVRNSPEHSAGGVPWTVPRLRGRRTPARLVPASRQDRTGLCPVTGHMESRALCKLGRGAVGRGCEAPSYRPILLRHLQRPPPEPPFPVQGRASLIGRRADSDAPAEVVARNYAAAAAAGVTPVGGSAGGAQGGSAGRPVAAGAGDGM